MTPGADGSQFRVDLPGALCAVGNSERVNVWRSVDLSVDHPVLMFVRGYVVQRGLVAVALDAPHDDDRLHNGCVASL